MPPRRDLYQVPMIGDKPLNTPPLSLFRRSYIHRSDYIAFYITVQLFVILMSRWYNRGIVSDSCITY